MRNVQTDYVQRSSEILWIPGFAVFVLVCGWLGGLHLPISQKSLVWLLFGFVGLVFPLIVLFVLAGRSDNTEKWIRTLQRGFAVFFVLYSLFHVFRHLQSPGTVIPVLIELSAMLLIAVGRLHEPVLAVLKNNWVLGTILILVVGVCWSTDLSMIWFVPWSDLIEGSPYSSFLFLTAVLLSVAWVFDRSPFPGPLKKRWLLEAPVCLAVIVIFGMASLRTLTAGGLGIHYILSREIHHWGVYIGPIQMVRQGGILLWDVPSQYGFLSVILPAILPIRSVWQSFYLVVAASQFCTAIFLTVLLRSGRSGLLSFLLPLPLVLAVVFLKPWDPLGIVGTQMWPSMSAYRFGCDYALLAVAYASAVAGVGHRRQYLYNTVGTVIWTWGCFWSFETAVWGTLIWFPVLAHLVYRQGVQETDRGVGQKTRITLAAFWLCLPIVMFILAMGAIELFYRFHLGHGPDWSCYTDYFRAAKSGVFQHAYTLADAVTTYLWIPVIVLISLVAVASRVVKLGMATPELTLLIAAFTLVLSLNTYAIAELHPESMDECGEVFCFFAIASIFVVIRRLNLTGGWVVVLKAAQVPLLAIPLVVSYYMFGFLGPWARDTFVKPPALIDRQIPVADDSLNSLLLTAGVKQTDPIVYVDDNAMPVWTRDNPEHYQGLAPIWLPVVPCSLIGPLTADRLGVYINRYVERRGSGGWLVEIKRGDHFDPAYLNLVTDHLWEHCTPTKVYENSGYKLTYYVYQLPG